MLKALKGGRNRRFIGEKKRGKIQSDGETKKTARVGEWRGRRDGRVVYLVCVSPLYRLNAQFCH